MGCPASSRALVQGSNTDLPPDDVIFGTSIAGEAVRLSAQMAATTNIPVLLQGESGTGKEILARYIHSRSSWGDGALVKVNCPAIPSTLLESELFGYQKGAFTGADTSKPGRVELAHRGTLFLDEIAELDLGLQAKLLQLLQDGQFCRIGAQEESQVDVRVVCATNRQLEKEIKAGSFRQDLFYRVNVLTIELPPLRQRISDLAVLANFLLEVYAKKFNRAVKPLSARSLAFLRNYHWPGNIRELENLIKRYVIVGKEEAIIKSLENGHPEELHTDVPVDGIINIKSLENGHPEELHTDVPVDGIINIKQVVKQAAARLEQRIILRTLEAHLWNRRATARALSLSYAALLYKLRQAGIPPRGPGRRPKNKPRALPTSPPTVERTPGREDRPRGEFIRFP